MFACHGIDRVETLLQVLQAPRVSIEMIEKTIELTDRFFNLYLGAGKQIRGFIQCAGVVIDAGQTIKAAGQGVEHVACVAFTALLNHLAAN